MTVVTRAQGRDGTALLHALVTQHKTLPDELLRGGTARLTHVGPCGFTTLHAAVMVERFDLLPALVAAGAPIDMPVQCSYHDDQAEPLRQLLALGNHYYYDLTYVSDLDAGYTPLAYAVRLGRVEAVRQLLELGASAAAGSHGRTAVCALDRMPYCSTAIAKLLLPLGLERCLVEAPDSNGTWLGVFLHHHDKSEQEFGRELLAALEAKLTAGEVQLGGITQVLQLFLVFPYEDHPLLRHAEAALKGMAAAAANGQAIVVEDERERDLQLIHVSHCVARKGQAEVLQAILGLGLVPALLAWGEPTQLFLLDNICGGLNPTATLRVLCQAGMPVAACMLEAVVRHLEVDRVRALLSSMPPRGAVPGGASLVRLALDTYERRAPPDPSKCVDLSYDVARVVEALLAHGCQPAHDWSPSRLVGGTSPLCQAVVLLGTSGGCSWEPDVHRHWPPYFRAAARTLLLAARRGAREGPPGGAAGSRHDEGGCRLLGTLPHDVLLSILRQAAAPVSAWI